MRASSLSPQALLGLPLLAWRQVRRIGPLGAIILLHVGFFYALQSGLLHRAAQVVPNEVFATFITPDTPHDTPKPPPAAPKTVPVVHKSIAPPPMVPVVNTTPSPQAITAPPPPAAPAEPAAIAAPPTPPAPPVPAQPKTISSGIEYIQPPQPEYPALSRRMGEEGKVTLRVLVNEQGRAERADIQKSSGSARLDEAARQALVHALFRPHIEDGKAVAVYAIASISFNLDH